MIVKPSLLPSVSVLLPLAVLVGATIITGGILLTIDLGASPLMFFAPAQAQTAVHVLLLVMDCLPLLLVLTEVKPFKAQWGTISSLDQVAMIISTVMVVKTSCAAVMGMIGSLATLRMTNSSAGLGRIIS